VRVAHESVTSGHSGGNPRPVVQVAHSLSGRGDQWCMGRTTAAGRSRRQGFGSGILMG